jgi:DNA helicase II / ATP-dependent DNA helicase PcrA
VDKRIIFAVAGSGKTSLIIEKLTLEERSLLITYTENNFINLRKKIINKFGYFPDNIQVYSYFTFLYSFCYKPFLAFKVKAKGINWEKSLPMYEKATSPKHYMDSYRRLYHARIAKLFNQMNILDDINKRLEKYCDNLFIDEVQDFAGNDFNFLASMCKSNINITLVGDYFQHTFDTSRDGVTNRSLHADYQKYQDKFSATGLHVDLETLSSSYRCSPTICSFISSSIGITISSHREDVKSIELIEEPERIDELMRCSNTVKLFYQSHQKYQCYSKNWGASKGEDHYNDVCVILNNTTLKQFNSGKLDELVPQTKNKLYVACSRAKGNLYFISEKLLKKYKL